MGFFKRLFGVAKSPRRTALQRADHNLRETRWYIFYYPVGREPGSGWRFPKAYYGPYYDQATARAFKHAESVKSGEPPRCYRVKLLTLAGFKKIWGSAPGERHPGY